MGNNRKWARVIFGLIADWLKSRRKDTASSTSILDHVRHWRHLLAVIVIISGGFVAVVADPWALRSVLILYGLIVLVVLYAIRKQSPRERDPDSPAQATATMPAGPVMYYIAPTLAYNAYYARLHVELEKELFSLGGGVWWRYCLPQKEGAPYIYQCLEALLKHLRPQDLIVMVPKGLDDRDTAKEVRARLKEHPSARIVFLDQLPPQDFLDTEEYSFVGIDNRKVGIMAAFALHEKLVKADNYKYYVVRGPGGDARCNGFVEAVKRFEPQAVVAFLKIGDVDRIDSIPDLSVDTRDYPPTTAIGVFASNDETAVAMLIALRERDPTTTFVVGCDYTPEMRLIVDDARTHAIATIDTNICNQARETIQAIKHRVRHVQEPKLHPRTLNNEFEKLLEDLDFKEFWEEKK